MAIGVDQHSANSNGVTDRTPLLERMRRNKSTDLVNGNFLSGYNKIKVQLFAVVVIFSSTGEQVLRKILASNMYNYRWFLVQLFALFAFIQTGICLLFQVCQCSSRTKTSFEYSRSIFANIPLKSFFFMAILDTGQSLLLIISLGILPPTLSVLLPQIVVPFTLFYQSFRSSQYSCYSLVGAFLILGGCISAFILEIIYFRACNGSQSRGQILLNGCILIVGAIFGAISCTYKNTCLQTNNISIHAFNWATSGLQFLAGFVIAPLGVELQYIYQISIDWDISRNILVNYVQGWKCIAGINSQNGDLCQSLSGILCFEILIYIFSITVLQFGLTQLMCNTTRASCMPLTIMFSMHASLMTFWLLEENLFLSSYDCIWVISWRTIVSTAIITLGLIISHCQPTELHNLEIDVWANLEHFSAEYNKRRRQALEVQ